VFACGKRRILWFAVYLSNRVSALLISIYME